MAERFFDGPVLNSPYEYPARHWELDDDGQPTNNIIEGRRAARFITPVPAPRKQKAARSSPIWCSTRARVFPPREQQYDPMPIIGSLRQRVDEWRMIPDSANWQVPPERPGCSSIGALTTSAASSPSFARSKRWRRSSGSPKWRRSADATDRIFLDHLAGANEQANPDLARLALKLATGAGKTTVMAMLIAWQTINAVRRPNSRNFTRGFLVVTPGITIRDRLRVLQPNDADSYYQSRELVPSDMLPDLQKAKIVITNYHAFRRSENH